MPIVYPPEIAVPEEFGGIQVNHCKNPTCKNYGIPPDSTPRPFGIPVDASGVYVEPPDGYIFIKTGGKTAVALQCLKCGTRREIDKNPLKNNRAIHEEFNRLMARFEKTDPTRKRHTETCPNRGIGITDDPTRFVGYGKAESGSKRYACKACNTHCSVSANPYRRQRNCDLAAQVATLILVTHAPLRSIREGYGFGTSTVYGKVDFLYRQFRAFGIAQERKLLDGTIKIPRAYISVDRHTHRVNWNNHKKDEDRFVLIRTIGAADNSSRYVFAMHPAYDPDADVTGVETDTIRNGDFRNPHPLRQHSRLVLAKDFDEEAERAQTHTVFVPDVPSDARIEKTYEAAAERLDVEHPEEMTYEEKLPKKGVLVHPEYSIYAHFYYLHAMLPKCIEKIRFVFEQESSMRAACMSAFKDEIKARRCDAFFMQINKGLSNGEKKIVFDDKQKEFNLARTAFPGLDEDEVKLALIKEQIPKIKEKGYWKDRWMVHPLPDIREPEKRVCFLTDYGDYDDDRMAKIYKRIDLWGIDTFFSYLRLKINYFKKPTKLWPEFGPYNPVKMIRMLEIARVYYNFVHTSRPSKDDPKPVPPAMKLGLASKRFTVKDILEFK